MKFVHAFRSRKPACAAIIGLLFGPGVVMAYLGRGFLAVCYFLGTSALLAGQLLFLLRFVGLEPENVLLTSLGLRAIGAVHGYLSAKEIGFRQNYPWYSRWYSLVLVFGVVPAALALLIKSLLFQSFTIPAGSMAPTVRAGDYLIADKYAYGYSRYSFPFGLGPETRLFGSAPERGDVVVFRHPHDTEVDYVKRIVGLPGDRVQMRSGVLHLNGEPIPREAAGSFDYRGRPVAAFKETLPPGMSYQVAEISIGSRGDDTAEFVVPEGQYFVLGDNRDNSNDSRFDLGFIPGDNIFARAMFVFSERNEGHGGWARVH